MDEYAVIVEMRHVFLHGDSMGEKQTYSVAFLGEAHGPSQATKLAIDGLTVSQAERIVRVRSIKVSDIPAVTYPKVGVKW